MKRPLTSCLIAGLLLTASACETPEETMVGEPPEDEVIAASRPAGPRRIKLPGDDSNKPKTKQPEALFGASVWPYMEEGTTFELAWDAQTTSLAVREQPDLNSGVVGEFKLAKGDTIPWRNTWVGVYQPALFVAKTQVELQGSRHAPDDRKLHEIPASATVAPGETIAVYHYAGAANCFVGVGKILMQAACPSPDRFNGDFSGRTRGEQMHPQKRVWWVFIQTQQASGWIPVDDRVLVDIVNL
jgi:hypothetical protein